jgi:NADH-quinone oxidoreductase subunit N
MNSVSYWELLQLTWPQVILVLTAFMVLTLDLTWLHNIQPRKRFISASMIAAAGCVLAWLHLLVWPAFGNFLGGVLIADPLTRFVQIALISLTIVSVLLSALYTHTQHYGEYLLLILFATVGALFLVATQNLLVLFVSLELLSLSLYVLTAFDKGSARSAEAALKYFIFGGVSAAFLLFGFSLLYGISNSINLKEIAQAIHGPTLPPLFIIALGATVIGLGFKVAAVPFHFWAPDVYEGAPVASAAMIASMSKVASFFLLFQFVVIGFAGVQGDAAWRHLLPGWTPVLAAAAVLSMLLGNLVAIVQSSVRRLLAYSAIAHAGYMLLSVVAHTQQSLAALLYYVVTYALTTIGAFVVVAVVQEQAGNDDLKSFSGLSRRDPVLAMGMVVFVLSLAGIPPFAGFFAKFYLFVAVLHATPGSLGLLWLVILATAMSAVSFYYYLQVLKRVYVMDAPEEASSRLCAPPLIRLIVLLLAGAVVVLGCAPELLVRPIEIAIQSAGM